MSPKPVSPKPVSPKPVSPTTVNPEPAISNPSLGAPPTAHAAGAVPYRLRPKGPQMLLIHRPKYHDWSLPKGHLDPGETYKKAALREVEEETGIGGELSSLIGSIGYRVGRRRKVVRYYLLAVNGSKFVPNSEADDARWLSPRRAIDLATYERDRLVLARAADLLSDAKTAKIHLVRHAMAGRRALWRGPDEERPLSGIGRRQASLITGRLLEHPVTRVLTSPYTRCVETVQPLASAIDIRVKTHPALAEGASVDDFFGLVRKLKGEAAVLCSHGDVITGVIEQLASKGVPLSGGLAWKKGSVWELDVVKGRIVSGSYQPPP